MNPFCSKTAEESSPSQKDIVQCPFLRNITEPTNIYFSSFMDFLFACKFIISHIDYHLMVAYSLMHARSTKGLIFEDGPGLTETWTDATTVQFFGIKGCYY